ncbi:hypothetical protein WYO_3644 [Methylobacterium sp. GXF4]|uniref:hypothetical protein n=1 Tax=Methylobacterium sp. GXF4 TaxID=1096546 RepID=UPI0002697CCC|nr:hypothetical protein [Methylobacterium sp. GXF4]EIZ83633.1 hypothetical protein WYO_3644 [Methylobacterium sp. GXF4]
MSYASYQVATDGAPTDTSNLIPKGPAKTTYNDQPGVITVNADGSTSVQRPRGMNTANFGAEAGQGVLSTARTRMGSPPINGITPNDIVTVQGIEVSVATAEQMGILMRDVSGRYVEVSGGTDRAQSAADAENRGTGMEDTAEAFSDPQAEQALTEVCSGVSAGLQVAALQEIIESGRADTQTINRAASEAGIEPFEMGARLSAVMQHFEDQAMKAVTGYGSEDPAGFFEWAEEHQPRGLKAAKQSHGMERTTKGYEPMYREYVASMAEHDPQAVLNAEFGSGITAKQVQGQVVLNIPGKGQMTYRGALKAGLIKVSGA